MGLGHVVLPVTDVAESLEFYTRVLGFLHRDSMLVAPPASSPTGCGSSPVTPGTTPSR